MASGRFIRFALALRDFSNNNSAEHCIFTLWGDVRGLISAVDSIFERLMNNNE